VLKYRKKIRIRSLLLLNILLYCMYVHKTKTKEGRTVFGGGGGGADTDQCFSTRDIKFTAV